MFVVDPATVRRVDAATIEGGIAGFELMDRAGSGAAAIIEAELGESPGSVVIVCGKGNNGGDGLVVARELHLAHRQVVAALMGENFGPDARAHLDLARRSGVETVELGDDPASRLAELFQERAGTYLVDAVLGTGTRLPLEGKLAELCRGMRECGRRILALDGPSGLDGSSGVTDAVCPVADLSVSFGLMKWGCVLRPGRDHCGRLHLVDLGFDRALVEASLDRNSDCAEWIDRAGAARWWPRRAVAAHKYNVGSVLVVGGSEGMSGAVALACNAAYRAGAGLVEAVVPSRVATAIDVQCVETLVHGVASTDRGGLSVPTLDGIRLRAASRDAVLVGPGAGADLETAALLLDFVAALEGPVVVDADGLNAAARTGRAHQFGPRSVITPHTGELSRLLGVDSSEIESDRRRWVREAASRLSTVVLHKGAPTFVADPTGRIAVVASGGPGLATAGSGDVLAGAITALLAAGSDPFEAACVGAWMHGRAGDLVESKRGVAGVLARDLVDAIALAGHELERTRP